MDSKKILDLLSFNSFFKQIKERTTLLVWIAWILIFLFAILKLDRNLYYIPIALIILSYILQKKYFEAIISGSTTTILFFIWFEWGATASLISCLVLLPILFLIYFIRIKIQKHRLLKQILEKP